MRILGSVVSLAAASMLFTLGFLDPNTVQAWIERGGPWVIFGLLFACGLGLPLPEDIPLIIGGIFAGQGKMNLVVVAILAWCGIIGGDCVLYSLGRKYGLNITRLPFIGKHLTKERILKAERYFDKYGIGVVAVGRLFAGIRGAMVVAAGTIRFNFVKFVIADGLAALVSGGLFVAIGYFFGRKYPTVAAIREAIKPVEHYVIAGLVAAVILVILYIWWRKKRHKTIDETVIEEVVGPPEPDPHSNRPTTDAVAK